MSTPTRARGTAEPAPVIAGLAAGLTALVAGALAISGIFDDHATQAARDDLAAIARVQETVHDEIGWYFAYQSHPDSEWRELADIGYDASDGVTAIVDITDDGSGWVGVARSGRGKMLVRTSAADRIGTVSDRGAAPADLPLPDGYELELLQRLVDDLAADAVHDFTRGGQREIDYLPGHT